MGGGTPETFSLLSEDYGLPNLINIKLLVKAATEEWRDPDFIVWLCEPTGPLP